jgi:hypothetical protein
MSNEIMKKEDTAIANYNYGDTSGAGFEDITTEDLQIPLTYVLQPMSPQLQEDDSLKPGMLWNNVSKKGVTEMEGVIVGAIRFFVEKKGKGGEYVRRHEENSDVVRKAVGARKSKKDPLQLPDGHILEENVHQFFVHPDLSFSGLVLRPSGLAPRRTLLTDLKFWQQRNGGRPAIWGTRVKITVEKKTVDGKTFYVPVFRAADGDWDKSAISPDSPLFKMATQVAGMIKAGAATVMESEKSEISNEDNCLA